MSFISHLVAAATCAATLGIAPSQAIAGDFRIVPSVRIGSVAIGQSKTDVIAALHKPTRTRKINDSTVVLTWIGEESLSKTMYFKKYLKRDYLAVFFVRGRVAQIEVSSPRFIAEGSGATGGNLSTGTGGWNKSFRVTNRVNYTWTATDRTAASPAAKHILVYDDDVPAGLACKYGEWADAAPEPPLDQGLPEAVIIHRRDTNVMLNPNDADDYSGTGHRKDPPDPRR